MNYRHAFHAGNFADVFKHLILTRILVYLAQKDTAFRFVDTHAGAGLYDLAGAAAEKTEEWRQGIGRLRDAEAQAPAQLLAPYLATVAAYIEERRHYPGSPMLAAALLRQQDKMIFCEAHGEVFQALKSHLGRDKRAKIIAIDGFTGLTAYVPPVERRGLVLIDPPFEARNEFAQIVASMAQALRKWPTGSYMIWFPIKDRGQVARFSRALFDIIAQAGVRDALQLELWIDDVAPDRPLAGCGLVLVNPPFVLEAEAGIILPYLAGVLGVANSAGYAIARF